MHTGATVGRYRLLERLGAGGAAYVYRAAETVAGGGERVVAIKQLLPSVLDDDQFLASFSREAGLIDALHHPNIVRMYEYGVANGVPYIALEYVEGHTLRSTMRRMSRAKRPMPVSVVLALLVQICDALDYAHEQVGLLHRDITPSNVIVRADGLLKLIDFGIAKGRGAMFGTNSGLVKGKLRYMAPETLKAGSQDATTDLFSVGIMAYEMLTGRRIYSGVEDRELVAKIVEAKAPSVRSQRSDVPERVSHIVARALQRKRTRRWQSAADMRRECNAAATELGMSVDRETVAAYVRELFADADTIPVQPPGLVCNNSYITPRRRHSALAAPTIRDDTPLFSATIGGEDALGAPTIRDDAAPTLIRSATGSGPARPESEAGVVVHFHPPRPRAPLALEFPDGTDGTGLPQLPPPIPRQPPPPIPPPIPQQSRAQTLQGLPPGPQPMLPDPSPMLPDPSPIHLELPAERTWLWFALAVVVAFCIGAAASLVF